jgi:hypothetical protein
MKIFLIKVQSFTRIISSRRNLKTSNQIKIYINHWALLESDALSLKESVIFWEIKDTKSKVKQDLPYMRTTVTMKNA